MTASSPMTDIDSLLAENNALRDEIALLTQENEILRRRLKRASATTSHAPRRHERAPEPNASDTGTNWRPPRSVNAGEAVRRGQDAAGIPSTTMGRPLQANELPIANPAKPAGAAPAVDLGYVNQVGADELDVLPYGLIVLDSEGSVLFYNETESKLAGYDRNKVVGKNFFKEVAPCTRVKGFEGRFEEFVAGKHGKVTFFDFAFHFSGGTQEVTIAFSHGRRRGQVNVMLMRK